jgi:drug/metabolite transporter (DMT)-like permease
VSAEVLWVVLLAALLHALWNAAVKHSVKGRLPSAAIFIGAGIVCVFLVPWVPVPAAGSWPFLLGSVVTHGFYSVMLGRAYRFGDFSHSYPVMRGVPPLLTVLLVGLFTEEILSGRQQLAMLVLCLGILSLVFESGFRQSARMASVGWALLVAVSIAIYTTLDGLGVRLSGSAAGYVVWLTLLEGVVLAVLVLVTQGAPMLVAVVRSWRLTLVGGCTSLLGYGLVLWAMTHAPIALVSAVRESSVIFAALIGVVAFKERLTPTRVIAIALVLAGIVAMRLA